MSIEAKTWLKVTGVQAIALERKAQREKWGDNHDDEHEDRSLSFAAVCYAAPVPLYTKEDTMSGFGFYDPWPENWGDRFDKRPRFKRGSRDGDLIPADAMPIPRRLRQLQVAGALIAAEMDRLIRRLQNSDEGDAE